MNTAQRATELARSGRWVEAIDAWSAALSAGMPQDQVACGIGIVFLLRQQYDVACENLEMAVAANPANLQAWSNLCVAYTRLGRVQDAFAACAHVLEREPENLSALGSLGTLCKDAALPAEAVGWNLRAAQAAPASTGVVSNLLWSMLHADECGPDDMRSIGEEFDRRAHAASAAPPWHPSPRKTGPLRVGWLSADLRNHAVGRFVVPLLEAFERTQIESHVFHASHVHDDWSQRARAVSHWHDVARLDDAALVRSLRAAQLDVLVELGGHTDGSRLAALAARAAPVQISWLGYPGSTGLSTIDHILVPPDPTLTAGGWCNEQPLALPDCYYVRDAASLDFGPLQRDEGIVRLGCLNNFAKLSPPCLNAWARILSAVPEAQLLLVITHGADASVQADVRERFAQRGVAPERVELAGRMDFDAYRATWHSLDLALDPFPFNGGTTGMDALCAGVPFVSLAGRSLHERLGTNLLRAIGLDELACDNADDYVHRAVELATTPAALHEVRTRLRAQLPGSPLLDLPRFASALQTTLAATASDSARAT